MAMASSHQSFLTNHLSPIFQHSKKVNPLVIVSCRSSMDKDPDQSDKKEMPLVKFAVVTLAAGVLALGSVDGAMAAKTGGRVGGQAFRSSAPRPSSPRINNSRTNIYINPPVAPPLICGYGYGGPFFGGYGWSPFSFFAPGPSVAVGIGGGFEIFAWFLVLGVVTTIIRSFRGPRDDEDDY
ncbi:hypothetical protein CKAN_02058400 [Cinnamomum micranthum f. kanehirae]|uniref:Transmembrane protein n=1 Tax=Cinnamomum micranthum f. kanehirae TaxID=337451 RepID=A0A3S3NNT4_9MAGN|nr:hypothetical protein CKAN_02058400 [Cinnamomum micranthum f. kanehirae]